MDKLKRSVLISIKPKFSQLIVNGKKTVELRKKVPANLAGRTVYVYSTCPEAKIIGFFQANRVEILPVSELWDRVRTEAGMEKEAFFDYYAEKEVGYAIFFHRFIVFDDPISLHVLRERNPGFVPPQNYHYIDPGDLFGLHLTY